MSRLPVEERLARGARRLDREMERLRTRFDQSVTGFAQGVEERLTSVLWEALTTARDAHDRILSEEGLDTALLADSATGSPAPSWDALRRYRQRVHREVLAPLQETLDRITPGETVADAVDDLRDTLAALHTGTPVSVEREEPGDLYASRPGDGVLRGAGKLLVRAGRGTGRLVTAPIRGVAALFGGGTPPAPRIQQVPLHELAGDFLRGSDSGAVSRVADALWQRHARPLARIETALGQWNRKWLAAEAILQPADGLLDPELARHLADVREQALNPPSWDLEEEGKAPVPETAAGEDGDDGPPEAAGADATDDPTGTDVSKGTDASEGTDARDGNAPEAEAGAPADTPAEPGTHGPAEDDPDSRPWLQPPQGHAMGPEEVMAGARLIAEAEEEEEADQAERRRNAALVDLRDSIRSLASALQDAAVRAGRVEVEEEVARFRERTWDRFVRAVESSDTFFAARERRTRDTRFEAADRARTRRRETWTGWFAGARARVAFTLSLLELRARWEEVHGTLLNQVGRQGIVKLAEEWLQARDHLMALQVEARRSPLLRARNLRERSDEAGAQLDAWRTRALEQLREHLLEPLERQHAAATIRTLVDESAEELAQLARSVPEEVELNVPQGSPGEVVPSVGRRVVALREIAEETLDAFRIEAVRSAPDPLLGVLEEAAVRSREIPEVVEYNLAAARDEVLKDEHPVPGEEGDDARRRQRAGDDGDDGAGPRPWEAEVRELTLQGLERTAHGVETLLSIFPPAWDRFVAGLQETLPPTFTELHGRAVAEGVVREQFMDLRSFFRRKGRVGWTEVRALWDRVVQRVRLFWRRIRPQLRGLLRMGRAAVGVAPAEGEEERAIEVLRTIPELVAPLPLVYRRLFSFRPVTDPSLLAGRKKESDWINDRLRGWESGRPLPAMLVASPGAGITSLYNAWTGTVFADLPVARLDFQRRFESEAELARALAEVLGLSGPFPTLEALAAAHDSREDEDAPRVVLLEGLEYLHLRGVASATLLGNLLNFQAHTSSSIFWISSMSDAAWSIFSVRQPVAATLVALLEVPPLRREDLERSILMRHRRSGLPLVFLPPSDLSPLKARKLRRTRDPEEKQAILQEDFFDRVHRLSMASPAMADVIWLRALDLESQEGQARVRAPRPIRFAFLESLTPAIDFALMAFLEHGSLTTGEYRRILHAEEEEVLRIFEALRTRMLLQATADADMIPRPVEFLDPTASYRIPQILGMAVSDRLRSLNILH